MADGTGNPLLDTKPPATDYLNYLIVVEHNLKPDLLPTLHEVLQDEELTKNIGWDLVALLVPLLPDSQECLKDIARLGNPREVILKVTEALRLIHYEDAELDSDVEMEGQKPTDAASGELPLPVLQFQALLSMLSVLQPRIKTKYPSRFLSTTLQAVLASYSEAITRANVHMDTLTAAVIQFIKTISGTKRPHLPSRGSSMALQVTPGEPGPAEKIDAEEPTPEEQGLLQKLLQSFTTHVLEEYMLHLAGEDTPGLAWSSRMQERLNPAKNVPFRQTFAQQFADDEILHAKVGTIGAIVALAQDLRLSTEALYTSIMDRKDELKGSREVEDEPPSSPDEIPLSKTGALFLYTARSIAGVLYGSAPLEELPETEELAIFPTHLTILRNFLQSDAPGVIGTEPPALLDSLLALGILALAANSIGLPDSDEAFYEYLQLTSVISANTPSPNLRFHAHYLTSTVLRSHPSDLVRLGFIRDTLEHCPYENLKAIAIGWLKGETLEANMPEKGHEHAPGASITEAAAESDASAPSIFATPVALSSVSSLLFPDLTTSLTAPSLEESYMNFRTSYGFYLAVLNFYYLLLKTPFRDALGVPTLHETADIGGSFLQPLRDCAQLFAEGLEDGKPLAVEEGSEHGVIHARMELSILGDVLGRVEGAVKAMNTKQ